MDTPVSFELAKLLKEKEFKKKCTAFYDMISNTQIDNAPPGNYNLTKQSVSIPTIVEVVMWLYEKHGVWTVVNVNIMGSWYFEHFDLKEKRNAQFKPTDTHYDSPTEAYEAAIEYTLKNLL